MTTTPRIDTELTSSRIASTAAPSPPSLSPRPTQRPAAMAPASVTRTSSRARLRSGASPRVRACERPSATNRIPTSLALLSWLLIVPEAIGPLELGCGCGRGLGYSGSDRGAAQAKRRCSRRAGAGGKTGQTAAAAGRPRHVLVARAAGDRVHRAGRHGRDVLVPAGRNHQGTVPSYDAAAALRADAQTLGFPVRLPRCPRAGRPTPAAAAVSQNGRTDPSTGQRLHAATSTVGYISPTGMYLSLTQSNADEDKLVGSIHPSAYPTGTVDVAAPTGSSIAAPAKAVRTPSRCGPRG